jgi:hypothetical protein
MRPNYRHYNPHCGERVYSQCLENLWHTVCYLFIVIRVYKQILNNLDGVGDRKERKSLFGVTTRIGRLSKLQLSMTKSLFCIEWAPNN